MKRSHKRLLLLFLIFAAVLVVAALLYRAGMEHLEGKPRTFWESLEWASETLSTTGYGRDATWTSPLMVMLVVLVQFLGVFMVFLIFPIYLIPFLEERFETRLPTSCEKLRDHVLIYRSGAAVHSLIEELKQHVGHEMGPIAKPEKITVVPQLPKTRSGKIMRRVLKARAQGLPEGDISTLEE